MTWRRRLEAHGRIAQLVEQRAPERPQVAGSNPVAPFDPWQPFLDAERAFGASHQQMNAFTNQMAQQLQNAQQNAAYLGLGGYGMTWTGGYWSQEARSKIEQDRAAWGFPSIFGS